MEPIYPLSYTSETGAVLRKALCPAPAVADQEKLAGKYREFGPAVAADIRDLPAENTLRLPVGGYPDQGDFLYRNGQYTVSKPPRAALMFGVDLVDHLPEGVELASASVATRGVTALLAYHGTVVAALVSGFNDADGAPNTCTWCYTCSDGSEGEVTIGFVKAAC